MFLEQSPQTVTSKVSTGSSKSLCRARPRTVALFWGKKHAPRDSARHELEGRYGRRAKWGAQIVRCCTRQLRHSAVFPPSRRATSVFPLAQVHAFSRRNGKRPKVRAPRELEGSNRMTLCSPATTLFGLPPPFRESLLITRTA